MTSKRRAEPCTRSSCVATRTSSATRMPAPPGRVRERWEAIKTEQEGRRASSTTSPSRCPRCSTRARCSAGRLRPGTTGPTSTGPLAKVARGARRARRGDRAGGPARTGDRAGRARRSASSATSSSRSSTSRAFLNVDPELALRATTAPLPRAGRARRASRGRGGRDLGRARARRAGAHGTSARRQSSGRACHRDGRRNAAVLVFRRGSEA